MKQLPELTGDPSERRFGALGQAPQLPWCGRASRNWRVLSPLPEASSHEFLERVEDWLAGPNRRDFLRISAASLALAGIGGCAYQPAESIVPYVQAPEDVVPGRPLFFATAVPIDGFACGVLVKSEMGRPIKIEGNPAHPASLGATSIFGQAALAFALRSRSLATGHTRRARSNRGSISRRWRLGIHQKLRAGRVRACAS